MKVSLIAILFLILSEALYGQILIEGTVIDQQTDQAIPTANIVIENTYRGTVSNSEGQFSLKVDTFPVSLNISLLGFQSEKILISKKDAKKYFTIALEPKVFNMQTVTVMDDYASNLVEKAVRKTLADSTLQIIGKAFYRQITQSDSVSTEFIEAFYNAKLSPIRIEDWKVMQGRYAVVAGDSVNGKVTMKDFSVFSRTSWVKDNTAAKDIKWPLRTDAGEFYNFYVKSRHKLKGKQSIIIAFEPKNDLAKPAFTGTVTIEDSSHSILQLQATVDPNDDFEMLSFPSKRIDTKNQSINIEYRSTEIEEGYYVPGTIKVDLSYDYVQRKPFFRRLFGGIDYKRRIHTKSLLYFYDYEIKGLANWVKDDSIDENADLTDYELINRTDYNPKFWENNPIIKRTPVEQQVIESFEKYGSFGKMFSQETQ